VSLAYETATSGPPPDAADPFSAGAIDLGFLCAPTYRWLAARDPSPVTLLGVAPVFDDPRAGARAVYFSDVIVAAGHGARELADLRGAIWAYNDACSHSGYFSLIDALGAPGELRCSGSHLASMAQVAGGEVDAACIDSNVLLLARRRDPTLARTLRIVDSLGPFPIQPIVARAGLDPDVRARVRAALLDGGDRFVEHAVTRFVAVRDEDYVARTC
jgi:phosphonate transport system substrate-binding protein